jgi:hypothetical protein
MPDEGRSFTWQTGIALGSLAVSLFGNWIQYQNLLEKKTELAQAQEKINASAEEARQRKAVREAKRQAMDERMQKLEQELEATELEFRRGAAGLAFAPVGQKPMAADIMKAATAEKEKLVVQKKALQDKIDALPTDSQVTPNPALERTDRHGLQLRLLTRRPAAQHRL